MMTLVVLIHLVVCVALIMIVLLQTGKGADIGAVFGSGGSQTLFGSTGATTFLAKATTVAAVVFMLTSGALAYYYSHRTSGSIMHEVKPPALPAQTQSDSATQSEQEGSPATPGAEPEAGGTSEKAPAEAEK